MILLGVETATEAVGVAIADGAGTLVEFRLSGRRRHGETLAPAIAHLLEQGGWSWADVGALAVDIGPGLFTGLRVGLAYAKGLALACDLRVVPITSTDVLAQAAADVGWEGPVLAVVDLRRGEVGVANYTVKVTPIPAAVTPPLSIPARTPIRLSEPIRIEPGALVQTLIEEAVGTETEVGHDPRPVLALGDGATRFAPLLGQVQHLRIAGSEAGTLSPATLVRVAAARLKSGIQPVAATSLVPLYLRDADVNINWATRRLPAVR